MMMTMNGKRIGSSLAGLLLGVAAAAPAVAAEPIALPGDRAFPESISATKDGTLYVGSLASGGILKIRPGQQPDVFLKPGASGTRSILGVLVDEAGGKLWACSNDVSGLGVKGPSDEKGSYLKAFDLTTGAEAVTAKLLPGNDNFCNDIAIGPDGAAYVTNSRAPEILRLAPGAGALEVWKSDPQWAPPEKGAGLDGLAFAADGTLYVDTFNKAELFKVAVKDGKAGEVTRLTPSKKLVLADALRPAGDGTFLMIEGAGSLDRITFDGDTAKVTVLKDGFDSPTGVAKVGDTMWVSEGQLPALFGQGKTPRLPFKVYPVAAPAAAR